MDWLTGKPYTCIYLSIYIYILYCVYIYIINKMRFNEDIVGNNRDIMEYIK